MRVLFFGTPDFAVPSLQALLAAGTDVALVVTQPDHGQGHLHRTPRPPAVKLVAEAAGLPIAQPDRPRGEEFYQQLRELNADLGVVVAYGHLLRPELLAIPRLGFVNIHASLLPRWRGAAPIHWALLSGDAETGVSIMRVEAGLDTGAVWHTRTHAMRPTDTTGLLFGELASLGAEALIEALPRITSGTEPVPQRDGAATIAPKVSREIARIDWRESADAVSSRIRAMDPRPGAWATIGGHEVKLFSPRIVSTSVEAAGAVIDTDHHLVVACGSSALEIAEVQPSGKRRMSALDWIRGSGLAPGAHFE
ncbi:MAG: methionyl-tRNA formyltransferase [Gemmatimonadales bacterium]